MLGSYAPLRTLTRKQWSLSSVAAGVLVLTWLLNDSGNWGVDLQAGSEYGYKLLFVVLLAGLFAVYMQVRMALT